MLISRWLHHYNLTSIRCNLTPILIASNEYRIIVVRVYRNKRMSLCSATLTYPQTCVAWRPSATCVSCQNCWRKWLDKDNSTRSKKNNNRNLTYNTLYSGIQCQLPITSEIRTPRWSYCAANPTCEIWSAGICLCCTMRPELLTNWPVRLQLVACGF